MDIGYSNIYTYIYILICIYRKCVCLGAGTENLRLRYSGQSLPCCWDDSSGASCCVLFSGDILGFRGVGQHTLNIYAAPSVSGHCFAYLEPLALGWANTNVFTVSIYTLLDSFILGPMFPLACEVLNVAIRKFEMLR